MAKAPIEIRSLARSHTSKAMATLVEIMRDKEVNASARVSAAQVMLDRGWGKATQPISGEDGGNIVVEILKRTYDQ